MLNGTLNKSEVTPKKWKTILIALAISAYIVVYWRRLLVYGLIPMDGDMLRLVFPTWVIGKRLLMDCSILWDPFRHMGLPFLASPPNQAMYPVRIVSLLTNFVDYMRIYLVFHTLVGCGFIYAYFWRRSANVLVSLFGALVWGFNGYVASKATVTVDFAAYAWMAPAVYFLHERRFVWLGVALAFQWLAGYPPFSILTGFFLLCYCFYINDFSYLKILFKGGVVTVGLVAFQFIPFIEMLNLSTRSLLLTSQEALRFSLHPIELLRQLFVPSPIFLRLAPLSSSDIAVTGFYFGPFIFSCMVVSIWKGGWRERRLATTAVLFFVLSLGQYISFYQALPFITIFRYPAHWLFPAVTACVLLAGDGFWRLQHRRLQVGILLSVALDFLIFSWPARFLWANLNFVERQIRSQSVVNALPLNGAHGSNKWEPEQIPITSDRVFHGLPVMGNILNWHLGSIEDWQVFFRMMVPSIGILSGHKEALSRHSLPGKRQFAYVRRLVEASPSSPLYDWAGIGKVITINRVLDEQSSPFPKHDEVIVKENPDKKPLVFFTETKAPGNESLGPLVHVEDKEKQKSERHSAMKQAMVKIIENKPGYFSLVTEGEGKLVVAEAYYPGWKAWVDGKAVPIKFFEELFISIDVSSGDHDVRFSYRPASVLFGAFFSILTGFMLLFLFIFRRGFLSKKLPLRIK